MIVGYTTGVFDMFHIGHLNLIRRAKEQCDYLVVGVTTDELCLNAKGKSPVIPFHERVEIIRAIRFVDDVVAQINYDKFDAWAQIKFNKMFVGSDWKGSAKWNELGERFSNIGVEIVYFDYTSHTSSTLLREKLDSYI